ncbi:MAG: phosphoribosylanthranilate isomerase [Lachnospiraceae bacterium]|nr:phosphoribosylanthranilate isomerase [Lachnospiraceae bacterium]
MSKIKFCGMRSAKDIESANEIKPEYVGFVFWDKSKRYITKEQAVELRKMLDKDIKAVGVFLDETEETICRISESNAIDIIQLHGHEDEIFINSIREKTGKPVIKAFVIRSEEDLKEAERSSADMILLDSGTGSGKTFDHELLKDFKRPFFLAGGMSCENVGSLIEEFDPYCVDVSSGIETDGIKDKDKMTEFAKKVRREI